MDKPYGDAPRDRVLAHIAQLKPVLQANADVIATVQVGFVGAWGEWYYTDHFGDQDNVGATQIADRKAVVEALLGSLPATRTVQVRTPTWKKRYPRLQLLPSSAPFSPLMQDRCRSLAFCVR